MTNITIENVKPNTVNFFGKCKCCGWLVAEVCCNDGFADNILDKNGEPLWCDWYAYCLNKGCINHTGSEVGQGSDNSWFLLNGVKV